MKPSSVRICLLDIYPGCNLHIVQIQAIPIASTGTRSGGSSSRGSTWMRAKKSSLVMPQPRSDHVAFRLFAVYPTGVMES